MSEREEENRRMVAYINDKYTEDHFAFAGTTGGHLGSNVRKILVTSENYPEAKVRVIRTRKNGEDVYTDTYLGAKFEEETRALLTARMKTAFGEAVYVSYTPDDLACTEGGSDRTTLEEYLAAGSSGVRFSAAAAPDVMVTEEEACRAAEELSRGLALTGKIYFFAEDPGFSEDGAHEKVQDAVEHGAYYAAVRFRKASPEASPQPVFEENSGGRP